MCGTFSESLSLTRGHLEIQSSSINRQMITASAPPLGTMDTYDALTRTACFKILTSGRWQKRPSRWDLLQLLYDSCIFCLPIPMSNKQERGVR